MMSKLIKQLQNPLIKIFASPLAMILVGSLLGMTQTMSINWISLINLIFIAITLHLLDHYFQHRLVKGDAHATPTIVLYACEAVLLINTIIFILTNYWILSILLIITILIYHIQYFPYVMVNTFMQYLLILVSSTIFLNVISYYSQTTSLSSQTLMRLIPPLVLFAGLQIEHFHLRYGRPGQTIRPLYRFTCLGLSFLAIGIATYFALPSRFFYIPEIIFVVLSLLTILPLLVQVDTDHKRQNKINYLGAINLIVNILYTLALIW